jgi:flagellar biogenesis protein FliO
MGAALRMLAALVVLGAGAWLLVHWKRGHAAGRRPLAVIDRAALSRGASVVLVGVAGRRLLLGVHPEGVRLLKDLGEGVSPEPASAFDAVLAQIDGRGDEAPL